MTYLRWGVCLKSLPEIRADSSDWYTFTVTGFICGRIAAAPEYYVFLYFYITYPYSFRVPEAVHVGPCGFPLDSTTHM